MFGKNHSYALRPPYFMLNCRTLSSFQYKRYVVSGRDYYPI